MNKHVTLFCLVFMLTLPSVYGYSHWQEYTTITTGTHTFHEPRGVLIRYLLLDLQIDSTSGIVSVGQQEFVDLMSNLNITSSSLVDELDVVEDISIPRIGFNKSKFISNMNTVYSYTQTQQLLPWLNALESSFSQRYPFAAREALQQAGSLEPRVLSVRCVYMSYTEDRDAPITLHPVCENRGQRDLQLQNVISMLPTLTTPHPLRDYLANPDLPTHVSVDLKISAEMRAERYTVDNTLTGKWKVPSDKVDIEFLPEDTAYFPDLTWDRNLKIKGYVYREPNIDNLLEVKGIYDSIKYGAAITAAGFYTYAWYLGAIPASQYGTVMKSIGSSVIIPTIPDPVAIAVIAAIVIATQAEHHASVASTLNNRADDLKDIAHAHLSTFGRMAARLKYLDQVYPQLADQSTASIHLELEPPANLKITAIEEDHGIGLFKILLATPAGDTYVYDYLDHMSVTSGTTAVWDMSEHLDWNQDYEITAGIYDFDYFGNFTGYSIAPGEPFSVNVGEFMNPNESWVHTQFNLEEQMFRIKASDSDYAGNVPFAVRMNGETIHTAEANSQGIFWSPEGVVTEEGHFLLEFIPDDLDVNGNSVGEGESTQNRMKLTNRGFEKCFFIGRNNIFCARSNQEKEELVNTILDSRKFYDLSSIYFLGQDPSPFSHSTIPIVFHENKLTFPGVVAVTDQTKPLLKNHFLLVPEKKQLLFIDAQPNEDQGQLQVYTTLSNPSHADAFHVSGPESIVLPLIEGGEVYIGIQGKEANLFSENGNPYATEYNVTARIESIPMVERNVVYNQSNYRRSGHMVYEFQAELPHTYIQINYQGDVTPAIYSHGENLPAECYQSQCFLKTELSKEKIYIVYNTQFNETVEEEVNYQFEINSFSVAEIMIAL